MDFLSEVKKTKLTEFVKFVKDEIGIEKFPVVIVQNGCGQIKTTASYNYSGKEKTIRVNGEGRSLVDIMRSIAHEMVHHKQFEDGRLEVKPQDIGGEIEDEANAIAGQLIKIYYKEDPEIYES